jgi:NAD+ kinase
MPTIDHEPGGGSVTIGVVSDDTVETATIVEYLEAADRRVIVGSAGEMVDASPTFVVSLGESALVELIRYQCTVPILPVCAGEMVGSVPKSAIETALQGVLDGHISAVDQPVLSVSLDGTSLNRALMDVTVMTTEPAAISEYSVSTEATEIGRFRADGVVVATPAGSHGYAHAAGGPIIDSQRDVVTVVPIAPFLTRDIHWILDAGDVRIDVTREETPVTLYLDGLPAESESDSYWVRAQLRPDASPFPSEIVDFFLEPAAIRREAQFVQTDTVRQWQGVYAVPVDSSDAPLPKHDLPTALVEVHRPVAAVADPDQRLAGAVVRQQHARRLHRRAVLPEPPKRPAEFVPNRLEVGLCGRRHGPSERAVDTKAEPRGGSGSETGRSRA